MDRDGRVAWVDYAKGYCIIFVVMMHSTLGVEAALGQDGWMNAIVAFAKPFRMPDFFLISGLFLARVIDRDWRTYLDRKVVHFAYFYVLWATIQLAVKSPLFMVTGGAAGVAWLWLESLWEPFGTLWFIYLLPIFFVVTRWLRAWNVPPIVVVLGAAGLEMTHIATGSTVIDEFAARFVYFYVGYIAADYVFDLADNIMRERPRAIAWLFFWGAFNGTLVAWGWSELPGVSLLLGFVGALAVVTAASLMATSDLFKPLRYCGRHSLVIYLAFFLPMAASRTLFVKSGLDLDVGLVSLIVTLCGIVGALALFWAVRGTALKFLFERPQAFRLRTAAPTSREALQPAE